jgi:antitoxin (DNA-binding transcriptional repressor) of toxin-antitoxin stability system
MSDESVAKISATVLAHPLRECLDRVEYGRETIEVHRNNMTVAKLVPAQELHMTRTLADAMKDFAGKSTYNVWGDFATCR